MLSKSAILEAMQFSSLNTRDPINTTGSPRKVITFQYAGTSEPGDMPTSGKGFTGYVSLSSAEKTAFRDALDHIETFLNVRFVKVTGKTDPDLNVGKADLPSGTAGFAGPSLSFIGSTITRWDGFVLYDSAKDLSAADQVNLILHELGHALGLKHPFDAPTLPSSRENSKFSVMSYTENPDNGKDSDAMQLYDVFGLQDIWGAPSYRTGPTTYRGSRTDTIDTVFDSKGNDSFVAKASHGSVDLDLRQGKFSSFGDIDDVSIAYGTRIENATGGSRGDTLTGNAQNNKLTGKGGNDDLIGREGRDTLSGGSGRDTLKGGSGNDKLYGGSTRDRLEGGTGKDTLNGEAGPDTLFGNAGADRFVFKKGGGSDIIRDFRDDSDSLRIMNHGSKASVLSKASNVGDDVVFAFDNGDMLTVRDITKADLSDDVLV